MIMQISQHQKGCILTVLSGLCFGLLGYFGQTIVHNGLSLYTMLFWRFLIAALFMFCLLPMDEKKQLFTNKTNQSIIMHGILYYGFTAIAYFRASDYIGTGLAMVIFFVYPILILLFNTLYYRYAITIIDYIALPMLAIGLICLSNLQGMTLSLYGIGLAVISAVFYAAYILVSKSKRVNAKTSTCLVSLGAAITCLAAALYDNSFIVPTNGLMWINIFAISILCTALPILLFLRGLNYISSLQASMLSVLEPVFVLISGVILLHETVSTIQYWGVVITLSSAIISLMPVQNKSIEEHC